MQITAVAAFPDDRLIPLENSIGLEVGGKKYPVELVIEDNEAKAESAVKANTKMITEDEVLGKNLQLVIQARDIHGNRLSVDHGAYHEMVRIGEESGTLTEVLDQVDLWYHSVTLDGVEQVRAVTLGDIGLALIYAGIAVAQGAGTADPLGVARLQLAPDLELGGVAVAEAAADPIVSVAADETGPVEIVPHKADGRQTGTVIWEKLWIRSNAASPAARPPLLNASWYS